MSCYVLRGKSSKFLNLVRFSFSNPFSIVIYLYFRTNIFKNQEVEKNLLLFFSRRESFIFFLFTQGVFGKWRNLKKYSIRSLRILSKKLSLIFEDTQRSCEAISLMFVATFVGIASSFFLAMTTT